MSLRTICLHGPESTGKSTMAPRLARHFDSVCVGEFGRTYCERYGTDLTMADLVMIARVQDLKGRVEEAVELLGKNLQPVKAKADSIKQVRDKGFWSAARVQHLEGLRSELRSVMKYQQLPTTTRVVLLQHPRERDMAIGTARMAHLCLPNSELHIGVDFEAQAEVTRALSNPERPAILLYPGEGARDVVKEPPTGPVTLVVVDGNMALLTYNLVNYVTDSQGGETVGSRWNSTTVYQRFGDVWKTIHSHWSFTRHPAFQTMTPEATEGLNA